MMIKCVPCVDDDENDTESDERSEDDLGGEIVRFQSGPPGPGVVGRRGNVEGWREKHRE